MTAILALIRKDLILFLSDRRALLLNLGMPLVLGAFFGYLFGGSGTVENAKINVALVLQDDSEISRKIASSLKLDSALSVQDLSLAQAQEQVRKGKLNAAIVIPTGFGEAAGAALFGANAKPEIPVYYDPSQSAALAMVKGMLTQQVMQVVSTEMFSGKSGAHLIDNSLQALQTRAATDADSAELVQLLNSVKKYQERATPANGNASGAAGGLAMPYTTRDEAMSSGPKYNGYGHAFAGMSVQFILFMGIDAGIGILLAQRQGLWNRLLASPVGLYRVLLARALSSALIAFGMLCFIFLVANLVFKVRIDGSVPGFIGVGACFALVTATFGLLIAAYGKTPEAARGLAVFATLLMVMLSGAWVPAFLFPQWLQAATLVMPTRWAVDGLDAATWRGLGLDAVLPAMGAQLAFALLFAILALAKFRRNMLRDS
ncbi:MAG TPA: ABC transporter permease [Paucimonas sp.]|nr:ABC transporter permease [Paucimonas sp.]HJW57835.1 ABC transporter permease [Burkholderiaceae bacterium]